MFKNYQNFPANLGYIFVYPLKTPVTWLKVPIFAIDVKQSIFWKSAEAVQSMETLQTLGKIAQFPPIQRRNIFLLGVFSNEE